MRLNIELTAYEAKSAILSGVLLPLLEQCSADKATPTTQCEENEPTVDITQPTEELEDEAPTAPAPVVESEETAPGVPVVPTTSPAYTIEEVQQAAIKLMDQGKQAQLMELLSAYNVQSLPELPAEDIGNFALSLRELGAEI